MRFYAPISIKCPKSNHRRLIGIQEPKLVLITGCVGLALNLISAAFLHGTFTAYMVSPLVVTITLNSAYQSIMITIMTTAMAMERRIPKRSIQTATASLRSTR